MTAPEVDTRKVYRCTCGWSGLLEHLTDGKNCANCGKQLAGDNEAVEAAVAKVGAISGEERIEAPRKRGKA